MAAAETTNNYTQLNQKFSGAGPRIGMDLAYNFTNFFAVYGKFAGALLIGDDKVNDTSFPGQFFHSSTLEVIPEFEGKLGLTYTHNLPLGDVIVDAGYMVVNYFSVFELPDNVSPALIWHFKVLTLVLNGLEILHN